MRNTTYSLGLIIIIFLSVACRTNARAQYPLIALTSVAGGASYTGLNAYFNLGLAYREHRIYAGPKMAVSKSYIPGRTLLGVNAGYLFSLMQQGRWNTSLNVDYQNTIYRSAPANPSNTLQEITGGLNLDYFLVEYKLALSLTMGSGIRIERAYNSYTTDKSTYAGAMYQVRLGLAYKLSRR